MYFITLICKNVARRPIRSGLTVCAISIAIGAMVALVGVTQGFRRSFRDLYASLGIDLLVMQANSSQRQEGTIDAEIAGQIQSLPGVKEVIPGLMDSVSFEDQGLNFVPVNGWVPGSTIFNHLEMVEGRTLEPGAEREVLLGTLLSKNLGKHVGDELQIFEDEVFHVVGVYESHNPIENNALVVALPELQRLMDREGQVTGLYVMLANRNDPAELQRVRTAIEAAAKGISALPTEEALSSTEVLRLFEAMAWLTSAVALLIGAVGVMNTMVMAVHERTREIGIFRAIGWRKSRIVRMIMIESVVLSLLGAMVGALGGVALVRGLSFVPAAQGAIDGSVDLSVIGQAFLIAVMIGLIGGIPPAIRAANLLPTVALRHE